MQWQFSAVVIILTLCSKKFAYNLRVVKVLSIPMLPDFRKSIAVSQVPSLRPFEFLVTAKNW